MAKILGLDLGTNSIGWAIINNETEKILGMGSRIFPEGVSDLGKGERERSKNAGRTLNRGVRKQYFRRKMRKQLLIKILRSKLMCPIKDEEFKEWFKINPYIIRAKAVTEEVSLLELGRVFYHISQRRGFLSNSRNASSKEDGAIYEPKDGKIGITETKEKIENATLGSYLASIVPKENTPYKSGQDRVRNRYTTRQMYVNEFEQIWNTQSQYHLVLDAELKNIIGGRTRDGYERDGILFFQRPLRSQKHTVGKCTFESKKTKIPVSAIPFELFRSHQFVNTIEYNGQKLNEEERYIALSVLLSKEKPTFKEIKRKLKKLDASYKFNYLDSDKIVGTYTISKLSEKSFFGKDWFTFSDTKQDEIWHILYSFDDKEKLKEYAMRKWNFDKDKADKISKLNLKKGYSNLSRKAINNILPFLKLGYTYDVAVGLGGVKNALGSDWETLSKKDRNFVIDNVPSIIRKNLEGGYIEHLKKVLKRHFNLDEKRLSKLYHHSTLILVSNILPKLPTGTKADKEISDIRNPIVIQALFELRKLVNALIDSYGSFDEIKVEMARDLKISKIKRQEIRRDNNAREKYTDAVRDELRKLHQTLNHTNILKYKLWEECQRTCPYTGKEISVEQLFSGEIQIEHIIPYSRSLDDSYLNKTLCFAEENERKGKKTPFEYYGESGVWDQIKSRALGLFYDTAQFPNRYKKYKRFITKTLPDDFISRQLNDTRYISKEAKNYLSKICNNIQIAPGQMTARLRHQWGLNSLIDETNIEKNRTDHRHHAIDALVMACHTRHHLMEISKWNRYNRSYELRDFPFPWDDFRLQAAQSVHKILVSHKKQNKVVSTRNFRVKRNGKTYSNKGVAVRGELHKETVFGRRMNNKGEEAFHVRKPLESLVTASQINKIVDPQIKEIIKTHLEQIGVDISNPKFKVPKGAFLTRNETGKIRSHIFLPNKNGDPIPVYKVRMRENIGNAVQLKKDKNQFVNPKNNHHILIYLDQENELKEDVVTFWEVVERIRQKQKMIQLPSDGVEVVTTLQKNEMYLLGLSDDEIEWENSVHLSQHLYRVQKISSSYYTFRHHLASTLDYKDDEVSIQSFKKWKTYNPIPVNISISGRITKKRK